MDEVEVLATFPCLISCFTLPTLAYRSNEKFIQRFVGLSSRSHFFQITRKSSFVVIQYFAQVYLKKINTVSKVANLYI